VQRSTRTTKELTQLRVALEATTRCTQAMMHSTDESLLMQQVCAIIVDAGYRFCWVGIAEQNDKRTVRPVASAGYENGYLSNIEITWSDSESGRGPVGSAIRTRTAKIIHDATKDSTFKPWRREAHRCGYMSVCALPLMDHGIAFGALNIYAADLDAFHAPELGVLTSLAETLAYGITLLRARTEQSRMQEQLHRAEEMAQLATEAADVGAWDWDLQTNQITWSDKARAVLAFPSDLGITYELFLNTIHPKDRDTVKRAISKTLQEKAGYRVEVRAVRPDGEICWIESWGHAFLDSSGKPVRILGVVRDITEQRWMEQEKQKLVEVVQNSPEFIGIATPDGQVLFVNRAGQELVGIESAERVSPTMIFDYLSSSDLSRFRQEILPVVLSGKPWGGELLLKHSRTGEMIPVEMRAFPISDARGEVIAIASLGRDIRERRLRDETLRLAEEKYRGIFDNAVFGIFQSTPEGRYQSVNPALARIFGYDSPQEMITMVTDIERQEYVNPDRRRELMRLLEEQGSVHNFALEIYKKDGSRGWGSLSARAARDERGKLIYYEGMYEDISERKQLEAQYQQAQKMEVVGRLAGGVAHDFNNILAVILSYCELTMDTADLTPRAARNTAHIRKAAERAASLTKQLLAFSRKQVVYPRVLDLNKVVHSSSDMIKRMVAEDITFSFKAYPDLGMVNADPGQIEQILMNLCLNARDAMPTGGMITIETNNVNLDENFVQQHSSMVPGLYVMLLVADTGGGIAKENLPHIFEPFFTTKGPGKGTGLGLATVYGIVKQSGGYIWVDSELNEGTVFKMYFPRVHEIENAAEAESEGETKGGTETILLVEDEAALSEVTAALLERGGYKVLKAESPATALALSHAMVERIDLVITDVIMPNMSGVELGTRLRGLRPGLRLLFMSGYAGDQLKDYVLSPEIAFLEKPFTKQSLLKKVWSVLHS
jgi:PAS domain S-box-containing protein